MRLLILACTYHNNITLLTFSTEPQTYVFDRTTKVSFPYVEIISLMQGTGLVCIELILQGEKMLLCPPCEEGANVVRILTAAEQQKFVHEQLLDEVREFRPPPSDLYFFCGMVDSLFCFVAMIFAYM